MGIVSEFPAGSTGPPSGRISIFDPEAAVGDIGEEDWRIFNQLTSVELTEEEKELAARPDRLAPEAGEYLAVHWHPEWAPLELIHRRLGRAFPRAERYLAIPTQHNRIMTLGPWAGVEADVFDRAYGLKVQLLIHFRADRLPRAGVLSAMMDRTYNYRAHQLLDILAALDRPDSVRLRPELKASVSDESIMMARFYAIRLRALIEESGIIGTDRGEMLKNRLLPDFMLARARETRLTDPALIYISAVKKEVKKKLSPDEFYSPREVIEEARGLGGGVVIPHPPQFWPILLSDLDVDGWEVWNPSTPDHAVFLVEALTRANAARRPGRELLAFMGDDTHMSAKFRRNAGDAKDSAYREIGFQDPWTEAAVRASLEKSGQSLERTLTEYSARLN